MIGKELKKLGRRELVDIIYQLKKNEQELQEQVASLEEALQEKRIRLSVAGSIAEAATDITQIFAAAQTTADLYLHEIAAMKDETQRECEARVEEARKKAEELLQEGQRQFEQLDARYQETYQKYQQLLCQIQTLEQEKRD